MSTAPEVDVTRVHFLGSIEYAAQFARLRPLLFSQTGRIWDGIARREWFPNSGLVFSVAPELRFAPGESHWLFRVKPNERPSAAEKDVFVASQIRPATELLTDLEPVDEDTLRRLATDTGLESAPTHKGGAALAEEDDRWVIVNDFIRHEDGRWRPASGHTLRRLKVIQGDPVAICGQATSENRFFLPPIPLYSGETRNWIETRTFFEALAADLRRWLPHAPHRMKAQAAAQALREVTPYLDDISACRSDEAKAALSRATLTVNNAEELTGATTEIVEILMNTQPFKDAIQRQREEIYANLENEALRAVDQVERVARDRLLLEQKQIAAAIDEATGTLAKLKGEISDAERVAATMRHRGSENVEALRAQIDQLIDQAKREPAQILSSWLGVSGLFSHGYPASREQVSSAQPVVVDAPREKIASEELGIALFKASPGKNDGHPRLLLLDAAIRGRELPVLIGSMAREYAESWLKVVGGNGPIPVHCDPTLLSLRELTPGGSRGESAPLALAFATAKAMPSRPVVVLLDDFDPAATSFWLPELARAVRNPQRYGFPENILVLAILEADPSQMGLARARAAELFPIAFDDCTPLEDRGRSTDLGRELDLSLVSAPCRGTGWSERVTAFEAAARHTFSAEDSVELASGLRGFIQSSRGVNSEPQPTNSLEALLTDAARRISQVQGEKQHV